MTDFISAGGRDDTQVDGCTAERVSTQLPRPTPTDSAVLADHTTFRVGGRAKSVVRASSEKELIEAVRAADDAGERLLVLAGGSNVLVGDDDFDGTVVLVDNHGLTADVSECGGALVRVGAGERWDDFVAHTVTQEWAGVEALSGIPGLVGATPIQNVGAYGQEVAHTISRVRTWDRRTRQLRTFAAAECGFGYRSSVFKQSRPPQQPTGRFVVLEVFFQLQMANLSRPIKYAQLAGALGVELGDRVASSEVREAVLELRRSKGMVLDPEDHDTWSAGSFFTNPIVPAELAAGLPDAAPRFVQPDGAVKTSAAWLIDHAGFGKGHPGGGPATLSTKHVLALTNRGNAKASDLVDLARTVRAGVADKFGIRLEPEPVLVGLEI